MHFAVLEYYIRGSLFVVVFKGRAKDLRAEVAQKLGRLVGLETTCGDFLMIC